MRCRCQEVAELFRKLAAIEAKHIANVEAMGEGRELPQLSPWDLQWDDVESPEVVSHDEAHYLMTPYHALSLALVGEQRAAAFFARVADDAQDAEVRRMASRLRDEEQEHVALTGMNAISSATREAGPRIHASIPQGHWQRFVIRMGLPRGVPMLFMFSGVGQAGYYRGEYWK